MESTRTIKVEVDPGLLLGTVFVLLGQTAAVPKSRADVLVRDKHCSAADGADPDFADIFPQPTDEQLAAAAAKEAANAAKPISELIDWPGYGQLNKGGLTTVDGLKTYIAENGTLWAKRLELSDEDIVAIEERLAEPAKKKPAKKPAAE